MVCHIIIYVDMQTYIEFRLQDVLGVKALEHLRTENVLGLFHALTLERFLGSFFT